ncbi:MAG: hypothetical protein WC294_02245 [Methanoregula sp.]|jgi:hypothetical protein
MTEVTTEQPKTQTVQKDENGIDIVTGPFETWAFLDTRARNHFYARFRRLVNVNGIRYAEIDYACSSNEPEWKVRWCPLTEFVALPKCQPGDTAHCLWLFGKPYVLAQKDCKSGRALTEKEWMEICRDRHFYPEHFNRLVEA